MWVRRRRGRRGWRPAPRRRLGGQEGVCVPGNGRLQALRTPCHPSLPPIPAQSFLAGVGNWVADEVLYQARIHPEQRADALTEEQVQGSCLWGMGGMCGERSSLLGSRAWA